jgi:hypothetical protein
MRQDVVGDAGVALRVARAAGLLGGPFGGAPAPGFQTGKYYAPSAFFWLNNPVTLTANRLYRTWFYVGKTTTFLGGWFYNSGAADNGKKVRIGVWDENGNLKKDFGETILSAASAVRSAANTVTLPTGWYQVGLVADTAPALYAMTSFYPFSSAGYATASLTMQFGTFGLTANIAPESNTPIGDYAAFAYAALPDPITPATATIMAATGISFPLMGLYL